MSIPKCDGSEFDGPVGHDDSFQINSTKHCDSILVMLNTSFISSSSQIAGSGKQRLQAMKKLNELII